MKFSICIPNYNYGNYIGDTIASVLAQGYEDFEICISDNASTDDSVDVIRSFDDERIALSVNSMNVGFAGNLDRAGRMASGEIMIMLSSDDVMHPGALSRYASVFEWCRAAGVTAVVSASVDRIDSAGRKTGEIGPAELGWPPDAINSEIVALLGSPASRLTTAEVLAFCLPRMGTPFNFAATAYPRVAYEAVAGYGGRKLINPDKWFHWRLLAVLDVAVLIHPTMFGYRWHASNQESLEATSRALKFLVDDYVSTVELGDDVLAKAGLDREAIVRAFVDYDIGRHGLATLARRSRHEARRIVRFGRAVYPEVSTSSPPVWALRALLSLGPVGPACARAAEKLSGRTPEVTP